MLYLLLKFVHIIGASVLLGTGAGIAFFMLRAYWTRDSRVVAAVARIVVIADFIFTASAVVIQPITGTALALIGGYSLFDSWILMSAILYVIAGLFWLPVVGCSCVCIVWRPMLLLLVFLFRHDSISCFGYGFGLAFRPLVP